MLYTFIYVFFFILSYNLLSISVPSPCLPLTFPCLPYLSHLPLPHTNARLPTLSPRRSNLFRVFQPAFASLKEKKLVHFLHPTNFRYRTCARSRKCQACVFLLFSSPPLSLFFFFFLFSVQFYLQEDRWSGKIPCLPCEMPGSELKKEDKKKERKKMAE